MSGEFAVESAPLRTLAAAWDDMSSRCEIDEAESLRRCAEQLRMAVNENEVEHNATTHQADLVMHFVEGWLSVEHPEAARYLREHIKQIVEGLAEEGFDRPDPDPEPEPDAKHSIHVYGNGVRWVADCLCGFKGPARDDYAAAKADEDEHWGEA